MKKKKKENKKKGDERLAENSPTYASKEFTYPYPEKKCYLKGILEKDKVNQKEDNTGPVKPKVII